jgi:hypothetical protein
MTNAKISAPNICNKAVGNLQPSELLIINVSGYFQFLVWDRFPDADIALNG